MATINELLSQASEIRDENQEQRNTALRVGTLFVNLIQYASQFMTSAEINSALQQLSQSISEYLTGYAELNSAKSTLVWQQSPVVWLDSMGDALDIVNGGPSGYTPSAGDLYYMNRSGYQIFEASSGGSGVGYVAKPGVVYINKRTLRAYVWDGNDMVEIGDGLTSNIQISNMAETSDANIPVGKTHYIPNQAKLVYRVSSNNTFAWSPSQKLVYIDISTNTLYRWNGSSFHKVSSQGGGGGGITAAFVGNKLVIGNIGDMPLIQVDAGSITFPVTEENDTKTASFVVTGKNLTGAIALTLDDESGMFSLSANSIPAANANTPQTIVVTYAPTAIGTHSATITLTSGEASNTITLQGTAVEEIIPEININDGTSATIAAPSGETATKQIVVSANYLSPNEVVSFAIDGTNEIGVSPATLTADENGHIEAILTLSYTAGSTDVSGTLVASCQTIPSTSIGISGHVAVRLAAGSYFEIDGVRYTILTDTTTASAKAGSSFVSGQDVYIPASVNDSNSVVYDSSGNQISSSGLDYSVIAIAKSAFSTKSVGNVTIEEGVTTMGFRAFFGYASDIIGVGNISLPSTMIRFELTSNISQAFGQRSQASTSKVVALCERGWQRQIFPFKVYHIVLGNPSTMSVSNNAANAVFTDIAENGVVEISAITPPTMLNFFTTTPGTVESPTFPSVTLYVPDAAVAAYQADTTWTSVFAVDNIKGMSQKPSNL